MMAAISPAADNYEETLSTLEFAEIHRPNSEVTRLLRAAAGGGGGRDRGALAAMGVKALKAGLAALGLGTDGCFEKKDLVDRLAAAPAPAPASLAAADASAKVTKPKPRDLPVSLSVMT